MGTTFIDISHKIMKVIRWAISPILLIAGLVLLVMGLLIAFKPGPYQHTVLPQLGIVAIYLSVGVYILTDK